MSKKNVAIIMGGYSSEYAISINSGNVVYDTIKERYNAYRIHILKDQWVYVDDAQHSYPVNKEDFSVSVDGSKIVFDVVFNTIHGTPGENGFMQGYLAMIGLPQTSCDMYQAALTFNKRDLLAVLRPYGIPMATSVLYNAGDAIDSEAIVKKVGLPCFVKANRSGSSFGVTKVYETAQIPAAIETALKEDHQVLIESFLDGTEVSVGVITYNGETKALPATEIVSENDFFDYAAKYEGKSQEITPARITDDEAEKVKQLAVRIYNILDMKGLTRSDFIFHNGVPHFIEMNTTPGLSKESIIPQQSLAAGITLEDLFSNVIEAAIINQKPI